MYVNIRADGYRCACCIFTSRGGYQHVRYWKRKDDISTRCVLIETDLDNRGSTRKRAINKSVSSSTWRTWETKWDRKRREKKKREGKSRSHSGAVTGSRKREPAPMVLYRRAPLLVVCSPSLVKNADEPPTPEAVSSMSLSRIKREKEMSRRGRGGKNHILLVRMGYQLPPIVLERSKEWLAFTILRIGIWN